MHTMNLIKLWSKICAIYDFGGVRMLTHKISDRVFGTDNFREDIYRISMGADETQFRRLLEDIFCFETGDVLSLDNPKTYNEKIQWLKLYDSTKLKTKLSDKYLVREWIEKTVGSKYLIPLLGVWDNYDEIDFSILPDTFVLKCNHGCGHNLIVKEKAAIDHERYRILFSNWMNINDAYLFGFELQYRDIEHKIIAEEYIEQLDGDLLDYKIHVFDGKPKIVQVIGERDAIKHTAKEIFLDTDWNACDLMYHTYESFEQKPLKPENLEEMLFVAEQLGHEFRYVRVDLYNVSGRILFGEMTFTPFSGMGKWSSYDCNKKVGEWISIGRKE